MELFRESFVEVAKSTLGRAPEEALMPLRRGFMASIKMLEGDGKTARREMVLIYNKAFLRIVASALLGDKNPDIDTMDDLSAELTNLVVGKAKVLNQSAKHNFNISTPDFHGVKAIKNYNNGLHFRVGAGRCSIFMREV